MNANQLYYYVQGLFKGKEGSSWTYIEMQELLGLLKEATAPNSADSFENRVCHWLVGFVSALSQSPASVVENDVLKNEFIEFVKEEHPKYTQFKINQAQIKAQELMESGFNPPSSSKPESKPYGGGVVFREQLKLRC